MGLCFKDENTAYHARLLEVFAKEPAFAPENWPSEVGNVLLHAERKGRIDAEDSAQLLALIEDLNVSVIQVAGSDSAGRVMDLARAHDLTIMMPCILIWQKKWVPCWQALTKNY